ncbi:MAG TPA: lysophospholipid acyltransferase family protein [Flavobacteriaceae bacterium]|nr:lysophospholipid acyltransferase family protein [Flavobacteriaceae bacterium]
MQLLFFIVFYPLIWVVSKLSFRLLYIVSDLVFYFIYYVLRYRRKTIYNNLKMVFPDKTKKEIKEISKNSVRNSTDTFVESFKSLSISEDEMKSRFRFKNIEVIHEIENKNQSVIVLCGHFSGFEWVFIVDRYIKSNFYAVYKRLRNKYFDRLVKKIRSRWNGHLIHTKETRKIIAENSKTNSLNLYGFASDQTPRIQKAVYWNYFMNIWVPIHTGAESIAKEHNLALVFMKIKKIKRGYYETTFEKITTTPRDYKDYELTDKYMKLIEDEIYNNPMLYLWSHRRWKHRDKVPPKK